jgi:hypothetical protein
LKDESDPVQVKHALAPQRDLAAAIQSLRQTVESLSGDGEKLHVTPSVGHELFRPGTLISKTPQMGLLAAGNPTPETFAISPLYQITVDESLKSEAVPA